MLPFLNVFKDGHLVDSLCLNSRDSFVLGRYTNCDVLLAHPSISRHHLEIQLLHATREILLTDMDSVHGTWVDGKQIPSLIPYAVKESVPIKLGASSRTYKVQWLHHTTSASGNERSRTHDSVDSNLSNTVSAIARSSNSSIPCMESGQKVCPLQLARTSDTCSNDNKTVCNVQKEGHSSRCCKHEVKTPYLAQEFSPTSCSANAIDALNAKLVLQSSQQQQQKGRLPPLPLASRRTPFAPLPQNAASPTIQKKPKPAEKKLANKAMEIDVDSIDNLRKEGEKNALIRSRLWLRRCNSAPSPVLNMPASIQQPSEQLEKPFTALHKNRPERLGSPIHQDPLVIKSVPNAIEENIHSSSITFSNQQTLKEEVAPESQVTACLPNNVISGESEQQGADQLLNCSSLDEAAVHDEYPSDKENQEPAPYMGKQSTRGRTCSINRKPFQPLIIMSHGVSRSSSPCSSSVSGQDDKSFFARQHSRPSSVVQNLDYMLQKLKGMAQSEPHYAWHIVVDSTCLLDPKSFKSLTLLEGIKEVRIIIPQIVIRELDFFNRKDKNCMPPNTVLKWIEACMLQHPSWIHVQNSSENLPIGASTPPASPHCAPSVCATTFGDLMSPTNGDHVLNCAQVFSTTIFDGQVALLTNDTALKIKAMAEGIVCDAVTSFCESLLSPYSERFLWAGSVAHHGSQKSYHSGLLEPSNQAIGELNRRTSFMSVTRAIASKKHHIVENLRNHCKQAQGLKVILS